jgi:flagellar FliL protein
MAEKKQAAEEPKPDEKPKKGMKPLIFGIVAVILIFNIALTGTILLRNKSASSKKQDVKKEEKIGAKVSLDEFLVNLSGGGDHYLKATLAIGTKEGVTEDQIKNDIPPIRDAIIAVLCSKTIDQVSTDAGREALKTELVNKINEELGSEKILKIYFLAFATQ